MWMAGASIDPNADVPNSHFTMLRPPKQSASHEGEDFRIEHSPCMPLLF